MGSLPPPHAGEANRLQALAANVRTLAWIGLRSFVGTFVLVSLFGVVLAACSFFYLNQFHWIHGLLGAFLCLVEAVATGFFFGLKRAIALTLAHALGTLRLGAALVRFLFERLLGMADGQELGERGGAMAKRIERLPLAQAEARLNSVVHQFTGDAEQAGWLARKIQTRLLDAVRKFTLARFRAQEAKHGGIDLLQIRQELEPTIDDKLVEKVSGGLKLWTLIVFLGLPAAAAAQTYLAILLLSHH
jgi:hypothetical protein